VIKALALTVTTCFALQLEAQPNVATGGVLNVASYSYPGLPNGSIAQGSMFVVFGGNLGTTSTGNLTFPLQPKLDNTSIQVSSGGTTVNALMIYTTPGQVAAILPSNTPTGSAMLTLTYNGQTSAPVDIQVVPSSFGAFTQNQAGSGPAVIQNYVSATDLPVNTILTPAVPGQTEILWGTGLGPVTYSDAGPTQPANMQAALNVQVWVGNQLATVSYAGRSGCCAAIDQIVFVVPPGVQGCYLPVAVQAGKAGVLSNFPSMAVESTAGAGCSDADGIDSADLTKLQSAGSIKLGSVNLTHISLSLAGTTLFSDVASGVFGTYSPAQLSASLGLTQSPSVGGCTVSQFLGLNPLPVDVIKPSPLNAGSSLSISGPPGTQPIASTSTGVYSATLGGVPLDMILSAKPEAAYFKPGSYTISGSGSLGSFSPQITIPADIDWTNSAAITTVDRSQDLTVTWTGGSPGEFVAISGTGSIASGGLGPSANTPGTVFICVAPATAGTYTVPSWVLQALPSTEGEIASSFLLVGVQTPAVKFGASGLDDGYVVYRGLSGNSVTIK
jgi:uncharacterized protein (TIGR03437 family)